MYSALKNSVEAQMTMLKQYLIHMLHGDTLNWPKNTRTKVTPIIWMAM
jgi:hypothetical protein